jgi:uncharacterized protein YkwD
MSISRRRRIALAIIAPAALVVAIALTLIGLQPVHAPTTSAVDARSAGAATEVNDQPDEGRVTTARNEVPPVAPVTPAAPAPPEPADSAPLAPSADPAEAEVLALVNSERSAAGCPALAWDETLAQVARLHSADMAARDYMDHTNPEGLSPFDRAAAAGTTASAENIAAGQQTAADVMASWMASPGHRANILNCSLTRIGVGVGYGGSYGITWTQLFGS